MKYCRHCGEALDPAATYCGGCGEPADGQRDGSDGDRWDFDDGQSDSEDSDPRAPTDDRWGTDDRDRSTTGAGPTQPDAADRGQRTGGRPTDERTELPQESGNWITFPLTFPTSSGLGPLAIASALYVGSFLVVPLFFLYGYCVKLCRAAAFGRREAPAFDDWGELFMDGLFFTAVGVAYFVVSVAGIGIVSALGDQVPTVGVAFDVVGVLLVLVLAYLLEAVLLLFVVTGSITAPFVPGNVASIAFTADYLIAWLVERVLLVGVGVVLVLSVVTVVGPLVVYAFAALMMASIWGLVFYRLDPEDVDTVEDAAGAASDEPVTHTADSVEEPWDESTGR